MESRRRPGRPKEARNKPKGSKQSLSNKYNRNRVTASVDSDEDTTVVAPSHNTGSRRPSKNTTSKLSKSKKRKQSSDDDEDVSDEIQVERRPAKRARQTNESSDEEDDSDDDHFAEEQSGVGSDVEDMEDEDSNPGSVSGPGDDPSSPDDTSSYQPQDSDHMSLDLTEEEKRVLVPPQQAIVRSKADWEYETQLPATSNLMDRAGVDDGYKDTVAFDDDWTEEDEKQLWNTWTRADALVLDKIETGERAVWRKVMYLFGIPAPEIIPPFLQVNPQHLRPVKVEVKTRRNPAGETVHLEHVNWGHGFCSYLVKILCTPAFSKDLAFLRYVLQYAVYLRLGKDEEKCPKPRSEDFFHDEEFFTLINDAADEWGMKRLSQEYTSLVNDTFSVNVLHKYHPHMAFIEELRKVVSDEKKKKPKKAGYLGIINLDLQHIINAWNLRYIKRKENYGTLTMEEYHRAYEKSGNSDKGQQPRGGISRTVQFANDRRNWILSCRRKQAIQEKQDSRRNSPSWASQIIDEEGNSRPISPTGTSRTNEAEKGRDELEEATSDKRDLPPPLSTGSPPTKDTSSVGYDDFLSDVSYGGEDTGYLMEATYETPEELAQNRKSPSPVSRLELQPPSEAPASQSGPRDTGSDDTPHLTLDVVGDCTDAEECGLTGLDVVEIKNESTRARFPNAIGHWKIYPDDTCDTLLTRPQEHPRHGYIRVDDSALMMGDVCPRTIPHVPLVQTVKAGFPLTNVTPLESEEPEVAVG